MALRGFLGIINLNLPHPIFVDSMKDELGNRYFDEKFPSKETMIQPYIMKHVKEELRKAYNSKPNCGSNI